MFVSVAYHDSAINGFKTGRAYTYKTELALHAGDIVAAPVKNRSTGAVEDKKAIVVETVLPEPTFPCSEITKLWTEPEAET